MKINVLFLLALVFISLSVSAQRGARIGYIDTEYILENVPEYKEATSQLEAKIQKWKSEIEGKLGAIEQKRNSLNNEKPLLTKELIEEREEDIIFEEKEILDYQQKRFGPNGDLMIQKKQLMQPIQDQIFAAVQDMAAGKKYDFIFDKSSDAVMLYSAKQFDLSERVLRSITRTSKRKQVQSRADRKAAEAEELIPEINEELEGRKKALEEKNAKRASMAETRRQEILAAREVKKKEAEARRKQILDDRKKAKQEKLDARKKTTGSAKKIGEQSKLNVDKETAGKTKAQLIEENRLKKLKQREIRKKELEDRKKKILEDRKKAKDSINNNN